MNKKVLVLDANILLRATFGRKVWKAIEEYAEAVRSAGQALVSWKLNNIFLT